ncbi:hypothetical protein HZZ00_18140 [Streptomyces sp. NEAU-sy36]|uniref:hypothetical protein n=1 Tax=unclassified Streptomyces TaxID=2593676 RepID=UPI0015D5DE35|nr:MULTISPECIES: hypothetical protein [unclassified Streptomyces]QLI99511.1 hypothetical protein HZZ00_18140 [Streptomyces sp. NEAU-sy36]
MNSPGEPAGTSQTDVDGWLAHALAAHLGHYRDPTASDEAQAARGEVLATLTERSGVFA